LPRQVESNQYMKIWSKLYKDALHISSIDVELNGRGKGKKTSFKRLNITLPVEIYDRLERKRGMIPRSRLIARILEKHLAEEV